MVTLKELQDEPARLSGLPECNLRSCDNRTNRADGFCETHAPTVTKAPGLDGIRYRPGDPSEPVGMIASDVVKEGQAAKNVEAAEGFADARRAMAEAGERAGAFADEQLVAAAVAICDAERCPARLDGGGICDVEECPHRERDDGLAEMAAETLRDVAKAFRPLLGMAGTRHPDPRQETERKAHEQGEGFKAGFAKALEIAALDCDAVAAESNAYDMGWSAAGAMTCARKIRLRANPPGPLPDTKWDKR